MTAQSYRFCRVQPTAQYVANRLAGAPVYTLPGGRSVVPLLHPQQHDLPFALTLELHSRPAPGEPSAAAAPPPATPDRRVYALHYVLAGSGELVRAGSREQLQAGDAVLMHAGAGACCMASEEQGAAAEGDVLQGQPWQLAELVAYMPQQLFEQTAHSAAGGGVDSLSAAASLRPLLQQGSGGAGRLPDEVVSLLLAGAKRTARQALQLGGDDSGGSAARQHAFASSISDEDGGSGQRPGGRLPLSFAAAMSGLAAWWQQQQQRTCPVTKRTLAELTAFQLPNQTNRLAVQFDPFSPPQVPFISGIEVFERGHRTTPHVHPTAHELFFILAGEGTGFCGAQRFPVSAGDVVVFRPGAVHGIDNGAGSRMYCLELMVPNEHFAEFVRTGTDTGGLAADDMCVLASIGCR